MFAFSAALCYDDFGEFVPKAAYSFDFNSIMNHIEGLCAYAQPVSIGRILCHTERSPKNRRKFSNI